MKITFINDWISILSKSRVGWGFAFISITYMNTGIKDLPLDGLNITLLGIGIRITKK